MTSALGRCGRGLFVEQHRGHDVLERLAPRLDDLAQVTTTPMTARRRWLQPWLEVHRDAAPWVVVVSSSSGRLVAAALLARRVVRGRLTVVAIGHGEGQRSRLPASDADAADCLARGLVTLLDDEPGPWTLQVDDLPPADPVAVSILQHEGVGTLAARPAIPKLTLGADRRASAYLRPSLLKQMRRAWARVARNSLSASISHLSDQRAIEGVLDEVEVVHRRRDHDRGGPSDLDSTEGVHLWQRRVLDHAATGEVEVGLLRLDGHLAAYTISLLDGPSWRLLDGRFDRRWAPFSPGRLIEIAVLERLLADERFVEVDWMHGLGSAGLIACNTWEPVESLVCQSRQGLGVTTAGGPGAGRGAGP